MEEMERPTLVGAMAACGGLGLGPAEIAWSLGFSREELKAMAEAWKALGEAVRRARDAALAWWEGQARRWARSAQANASLWGRAMAGRFANEGYGLAGRRAAGPEAPARPRREVNNIERAKRVWQMLAEAFPDPWAQRLVDLMAEAEAAAGSKGPMSGIVAEVVTPVRR